MTRFLFALLAFSLALPASDAQSRVRKKRRGRRVTKVAQATPNKSKDRSWYVQNVKFGLPHEILSSMAVSPSDTDYIYVGSATGEIFATHDGGLTWHDFSLEAPDKMPETGYSVSESYSNDLGDIRKMTPRSRWKWDFGAIILNQLNNFPLGVIGEPILELAPDSPAFRGNGTVVNFDDGILIFGAPSRTYLSLQGPNYNYKLNDPYKLSLVSSEASFYSLFDQGEVPTKGDVDRISLAIRAIAIHPTKPKTALAGTHIGIFRTQNGGITWTQVDKNGADTIAFSPDRPDLVFAGAEDADAVGLSASLRVSRNEGESFADLDAAKGDVPSAAKSIHFAYANSEYLYVGNGSGLYKSGDRGVNWEKTDKNPTVSVSSDAVVANKWYTTKLYAKRTREFKSAAEKAKRRDETTPGTFAGEGPSIRYLGFKYEGKFAGEPLLVVTGNPSQAQHVLAMTATAIWESQDGGESYRNLFLGGGEFLPQDIFFSQNEEETAWILTTNEILKLSRKPADNPSAYAAFRERVSREPSLTDTLDSSLRFFKVHPSVQNDLREQSRLRGYVPRLGASVGFRWVDNARGFIDAVYIDDVPRSQASPSAFADIVDDGDSVVLTRTNDWRVWYGGVELRWNLRELFFGGEEIQQGRNYEAANVLFHRVTLDVRRVYEERRRLLQKMYVSPPADAESQLKIQMRMEELTGQLNAYTDGAWESAQNWLNQWTWSDYLQRG